MTGIVVSRDLQLLGEWEFLRNYRDLAPRIT